MTIISPDKFFLLINLDFFSFIYIPVVFHMIPYISRSWQIFSKLKKKSLKLNKISATLPNAHI